MTRRFAAALALACSCALAALPARAQVSGIQAVYVPPSGGHLASWGVSTDLGFMVGVGPLGIWPALGAEYQRQRDLGPGRSRVSADVRFLPARFDLPFVPYVGGSLSANQSGGQQSEWRGTRTGFDALAGLILLRNDRSRIALSIQERFGYVVGQPHAFGTEAGIRFSWR